MLAKELAEFNDSAPYSNVRIKKAFINVNGDVEFDSKDLREYGESENETGEIEQKIGLPLISNVNLPDERTSKRQSSPYIYLLVEISNSKLKFALGKKPKVNEENKEGDAYFEYEIALDSGKGQILPNKDEKLLKLKLLGEDYYKVGNESLISLYEKDNIIEVATKHGNSKEIKADIRADILENVCNSFYKTYKNYLKDYATEKYKGKKLNFCIYLLPYQVKSEDIKYNEPDSEKANKVSTAKSNAKFISANDPAFTLNQTTVDGLKQLIGLSDSVFKRIKLLKNFQIPPKSGLYWKTFAIRGDRGKNFLDKKKENKGILTVLREVYKDIPDDIKGKSEIKIICFEQEQQKQTILISENLT
ncbi:MAG: hypothetical protein QXP04_04370, partial [Candidatus Nanoarchaeia archaeon]|nr:hypothetical protein [Candidatus Jingweiarchaeum tengchongense]